MKTKITFFSALLAHFALVIGLKLQNVTIPQYGWKHGSVRLDCDFDLESDSLLVLKWYKDENEIFSYSPSSKPPIRTFLIDGVYIDTSQSNLNHVVLRNITLKTGGSFKCEVSADRPTFKTLSKTSDMIVIAPPESDPEITGVHEVVSVGDYISANCTSLRSKPAASLMFYINEHKFEEPIEYSPQTDAEGLETSVLGIKFQVEASHFKKGVMMLKCTATIGNFYGVKTKLVSEANINAQPSIPGHNRLSSGARSGHSHHYYHHHHYHRGASLILILYGFFSFCGFLLNHQQPGKQLLLLISSSLFLLLLLFNNPSQPRLYYQYGSSTST